jgi:hypothetical protein
MSRLFSKTLQKLVVYQDEQNRFTGSWDLAFSLTDKDTGRNDVLRHLTLIQHRSNQVIRTPPNPPSKLSVFENLRDLRVGLDLGPDGGATMKALASLNYLRGITWHIE